MRACLVLLLLVAGCRTPESPDVAFNKIAAAAESGDTERFIEGFTAPSRSLLDGMLALSGPDSSLFRLGQFASRAEAKEFSEQSGGVALVLVQSTDSRPEVAQLVMRLEDGAWRIDLVSTELLWNRSWELSGKARRGDGMALGFDPLDSSRTQR